MLPFGQALGNVLAEEHSQPGYVQLPQLTSLGAQLLSSLGPYVSFPISWAFVCCVPLSLTFHHLLARHPWLSLGANSDLPPQAKVIPGPGG